MLKQKNYVNTKCSYHIVNCLQNIKKYQDQNIGEKIGDSNRKMGNPLFEKEGIKRIETQLKAKILPHSNLFYVENLNELFQDIKHHFQSVISNIKNSLFLIQKNIQIEKDYNLDMIESGTLFADIDAKVQKIMFKLQLFKQQELEKMNKKKLMANSFDFVKNNKTDAIYELEEQIKQFKKKYRREQRKIKGFVRNLKAIYRNNSIKTGGNIQVLQEIICDQNKNIVKVRSNSVQHQMTQNVQDNLRIQNKKIIESDQDSFSSDESSEFIDDIKIKKQELSQVNKPLPIKLTQKLDQFEQDQILKDNSKRLQYRKSAIAMDKSKQLALIVKNRQRLLQFEQMGDMKPQQFKTATLSANIGKVNRITLGVKSSQMYENHLKSDANKIKIDSIYYDIKQIKQPNFKWFQLLQKLYNQLKTDEQYKDTNCKLTKDLFDGINLLQLKGLKLDKPRLIELINKCEEKQNYTLQYVDFEILRLLLRKLDINIIELKKSSRLYQQICQNIKLDD